jgi:hypothetical protein
MEVIAIGKELLCLWTLTDMLCVLCVQEDQGVERVHSVPRLWRTLDLSTSVQAICCVQSRIQALKLGMICIHLIIIWTYPYFYNTTNESTSLTFPHWSFTLYWHGGDLFL